MKTIQEDFADGMAHGFPFCCVLKFCAEGGTSNDHQALDRGIVDPEGRNPYIPCGFLHGPTDPGDRLTLVQQHWSVGEGRYVND